MVNSTRPPEDDPSNFAQYDDARNFVRLGEHLLSGEVIVGDKTIVGVELEKEPGPAPDNSPTPEKGKSEPPKEPMVFDPSEFGLNPALPKDRALLAQAHGDRKLMELIQMREQMTELNQNRHFQDDPREFDALMHAIGRRLRERREELGLT